MTDDCCIHTCMYLLAVPMYPYNSSSFAADSQSNDPSLGKFTFPITDIARNGFIKDTWTLQDAEKGQVSRAEAKVSLMPVQGIA